MHVADLIKYRSIYLKTSSHLYVLLYITFVYSNVKNFTLCKIKIYKMWKFIFMCRRHFSYIVKQPVFGHMNVFLFTICKINLAYELFFSLSLHWDFSFFMDVVSLSMLILSVFTQALILLKDIYKTYWE